MRISTDYVQLYLRLALGIGFIVPVLDRIGLLGTLEQLMLPGETGAISSITPAC